MQGIDWSTLAANVGSVIIAMLTLLAGFWRKVGSQTKMLIQENAILAKDYQKDQESIRSDIEQLKKSDAEFKVIKAQYDAVQKSVEALGKRVDEAANQTRAELTGGLNSLRDDMREYVKAVTRSS
jgi:hypothetical protein